MKTLKEIKTASERLNYRLVGYTEEGMENYGIEVSTTLFGNEEKDCIRDISTDLEFTEKLMNTLADNSALPSTAREIIEEYITAHYTSH